MKKCPNCQADVPDDSKICPQCGANCEQTNTQPNPESSSTEEEKIDLAQNIKLMSILSYISILVLIPLFVCKNDDKVRRHCNEGLILLLLEVVVWVLFGILGAVLGTIPVLGVVLDILSWLSNVILLVMSVWGIYYVVKDIDKPLPFIGNFKILK